VSKQRIIYGVNPVIEAARSAPESVERILIASGRGDRASSNLLDAARTGNIEVARVAKKEIDALTGTGKHQGVAAVMAAEFGYTDLDLLISGWRASGERAFFLILDSVQDPGNLGSLIRSACAAGVHGVIIPKRRAAPVTPAVEKVSAGATAHTRIAAVTNITRAIEILKKEGIWVYGLVPGEPSDIYGEDLTVDAALVVGGESKGLTRLVRERCDHRVSIPMAGDFDSLNAAQAGAVAMFELRRQRGGG
jgi:23S rRNA (guanosine2251-2'-O)-methyltransferase